MEQTMQAQTAQTVLTAALEAARLERGGKVADYIPELAHVDPDVVSAAIQFVTGELITAGDNPHIYTLQSTAKLVPLIGLIEEYGQQKVFSWINAEPSGDSFASISQLEKFGAVPSNPMVNAGAIALCGRIPGNTMERRAWLDHWVARLFREPLAVNQKVFASECISGDRNRSLAYFLKSSNVLQIPVDEALDTYFYLCSFEGAVTHSAYLGMLLANGGRDLAGEPVLHGSTCQCVVAIMATCGLYDESGMWLVKTGLPAKSGVSGNMIAVALGTAGIAVSSPPINRKGGSIRGHLILDQVSRELGWHFGTIATRP